MGQLSLPHLLILVLILLLFFGPSKLPALGQSLGKAIRGFKEGLNEMDAESKDVGPQQQIKQNNDVVKQATSEIKKESNS